MFNWVREKIKAIKARRDKEIEQWLSGITANINESDQIQHS